MASFIDAETVDRYTAEGRWDLTTVSERICAVASLRRDACLELADLVHFLPDRGISKELYPEHLLILDELPCSSGAKVVRGQVRETALRRNTGAGTSGAALAEAGSS